MWLAWLLLGACKHGDTDDTHDTDTGPASSAFRVSADVERERTVSARADRVVGIAHRRGSVAFAASEPARFAPLDADGAFAIDLDTRFDWSLFLVDSTATDPRARVIAPIGIGLDDASLLDISGGHVTGDIEAGRLVDDGDGVRTDTTTAEASAWFTLDAASLDVLGVADDVLAGLANAAANTAPDAPRYWTRTTYGWEGDFAETGAALPVRYRGFSLDVGAFGGPLDADKVNAGEQVVALRPPVDVVIDGVTFGPDAPMSPRWTHKGSDGASTVTFADPAPNTSEIEPFDPMPPGWWSFEVDGVEVAAFDLALAVPMTADGLPVGVYPTVVLDDPTDGAVSGGTLAWRLRSPATGTDEPIAADAFADVAAGTWAKAFGHVGGLGGTEVTVEAGSNPESPPLTAFAVDDWSTRWAAPDLPADQPFLAALWAGVSIGDVGTSVTYFERCADGDHDGVSVCDEGTGADTDAAVYPGAVEVCGDGRDNGMEGDGDAVCAVDVTWLGADVVPFTPAEDGPNGQWAGFLAQVVGAEQADQALWMQIGSFYDDDVCGLGWGTGDRPDRELGTLGLYGTSYQYGYLAPRGCDPYVAPDGGSLRGLVRLGREGEAEFERHVFELPEVLAVEDAASVISDVWFDSATALVGQPFAMHVRGRTPTAGRLYVTPWSSPTGEINPFTLRLVTARLDLFDAGTGDPLTLVCLDAACTETTVPPASGRLAVWLPDGGDVAWEATFYLEWTVGGVNTAPATPVAWGENDAGEVTHTALDAAWHALPNLPAAQ